MFYVFKIRINGVKMKKTGLILLGMILLWGFLFAIPQPLHMIPSSKTKGASFGTDHFHIQGSIVYCLDNASSTLKAWDMNKKAFLQPVFAKLPLGSVATDICGDENFLYILDSKKSSIYVLNYDGSINRIITGKGSPDIQFKKAISILVNYQGYIFVLDAGRNELLAFTNEGMFMGKAQVFAPLSMCLGLDQLIRVLIDKKTHQEIITFDQDLNPSKSYEILTPQNKPDYVSDIAINQYSEIYTLYSKSTKIGKVDNSGRLLTKTWGSKEKSESMVSFQQPSRIKAVADQNNAILAILDSKSRVVKLYQDSDFVNLVKLEPPQYTMRPFLEKTTDPLSYDNVILDSLNYYLYDATVSINNAKKITRAIVCKSQGKVKYTIYALNEVKNGVKSLDAIAVHNDKLFVVDGKACKIHIFNSKNGKYQESFAAKGSKDGRLNNPRSIVVAPDGMIYVADWGNSRIAVFNENTMFIENIELSEMKLKPQLLRLNGAYLYFLANDSMIYEITLANVKNINKLAEMKKITSFDILYENRLGFIDGTNQQLYILHNNKSEHKYFAKSAKSVFPGFGNIYHIRYNPVDRSLFISDRLADSVRKLSFYYSPKKPQTIRLTINQHLQAQLEWEITEGINRWVVTEVSDKGTISYTVNEPRLVIRNPQPGINRYSVCAISADGKAGPSSEEIEDAYSYGRYLTASNNYSQAALALQRATKTITDTRLDEEIIKNYLAESEYLVRMQEYEKAIKSIEAASAVGGRRIEFVLATINIYKLMKEYQQGISYLEKFKADDNKDVQKQLISLYYLNSNYPKVQSLSTVFLARFGNDPEVILFLATAYEKRGDYSSALSSLRELVTLDDNLENNLKIGELLILSKKYDEATGHLQRMLTRFRDQGNDAINKLLGDVYYSTGSYGYATDYYNNAIRINPANAEYYYCLGLAYTEDRKSSEAKLNLAKAYELNSENVPYAFAYAKSLERENRFAEALKVLDTIYKYVSTDSTTTSYLDFYADLLFRERRYEDAFNVLTTAVQYAPEDKALLAKLNTAMQAREEENRNKPAVDVKAFYFDIIFPALIESYKTNPIGLIKLINTRNIPIRDVKVTVFIPQITDRSFEQVIPSLLPGQDHNVDVVLPLNKNLLDLCKDGPQSFPTELWVDYVFEDKPLRVKALTTVLNAMGISAMNWKDRKQYASFVNPQDENLRNFANTQITQLFSNVGSGQLNKNIQRAIQVWSYYSANNIRYVSDPTSSNLTGSEVDYVQYPFQTLSRKAGDCEDLLALIASTLSVIGVPCGFLDIPAHVMMVLDTGMKPDEVMTSGIELNQFIYQNNKYWVPLETTLLGKESFPTSWMEAIKRYNSLIDQGTFPDLIEFSEAHKLYPPSPYSDVIPLRQFDGGTQALSSFRKDSDDIMLMGQIAKEEEYVKTLQKYPTNLNVANQYALWCIENNRPATAQGLWEQILAQDPSNFAALVNLGSLQLSNNQYDQARPKFLEALKQNREKDNIIRNLCILEYRSGNIAKAREYFAQLSDKNVLKNLDPKTYADLLGSGE
jgi:tetratricopeptide (TPR) repeat protein/sugar lactone lactonase YvrE